MTDHDHDAPRRADHDAPRRADHDASRRTDRRDVVARERDAFGGVKIFCAFFGWLTATGMTVVLTALLAAVGAGVGLFADTSELTVAASDQASAEQIGWAGVVAVLLIVLVAYYAGGYVAGRMARFDGLRQGVAVFGWAVLVAIVVAVLGAVAGSQFDVLGELNSFPRLPSALSDLSVPAVVTLVGVVVAALVGAMLGGLAGMRFHRKVDRTGLGA